MASPRYTCGFHGCTFSTDDLGALAHHDVTAGHPNPSGDELAVALARTQQLCAGMGGHEPAPEDPNTCGVCGAAITETAGGRHLCRAAGCDYSTHDPAALVVHDVTAHGLREVRPMEAQKLQGLLAVNLCAVDGHVPNPFRPGVCLVCNSPLLEVPRV